MTATHERRITDLEAASYRLGRRMDDADSKRAEDTEHLTHAVGDLSQGQRARTLDVREIRTSVGDVHATLTEHGARLERIESTLAGHGELLRAILVRLGGKPDQGTD